ncbi:MAG: hypothetical protein Hyperionvirus6_100 [Hyperionvirus sp.]|uniref:Uncharacterized protein n=1 Tax=Hyperionvirus sp. TaxID=2487770 RepID=A0A3G5ADH3_9VIRU|nr:MAG: hypothetical protein Hyperionvirus6_100 [Hyperionvirus sp.]
MVKKDDKIADRSAARPVPAMKFGFTQEQAIAPVPISLPVSLAIYRAAKGLDSYTYVSDATFHTVGEFLTKDGTLTNTLGYPSGQTNQMYLCGNTAGFKVTVLGLPVTAAFTGAVNATLYAALGGGSNDPFEEVVSIPPMAGNTQPLGPITGTSSSAILGENVVSIASEQRLVFTLPNATGGGEIDDDLNAAVAAAATDAGVSGYNPYSVAFTNQVQGTQEMLAVTYFNPAPNPMAPATTIVIYTIPVDRELPIQAQKIEDASFSSGTGLAWFNDFTLLATTTENTILSYRATVAIPLGPILDAKCTTLHTNNLLALATPNYASSDAYYSIVALNNMSTVKRLRKVDCTGPRPCPPKPCRPVRRRRRCDTDNNSDSD